MSIDTEKEREALLELAYRIEESDGKPIAIHRDAAKAIRATLAASAAPQEPFVRYCPGCGHIGSVEAKYHDCCPDGNEARMIPQALAEKCRDTFKVAIKAMLADQAANDAVPAAQGAPQDALDAARWRFARRHWGRLMESYEPTPEGALDRIARIMIANDQQVRDGLAWDVDPESLDAAIDSAIAAGGNS